MKSLFEAATVDGGKNYFYHIYKIVDNRFFAEVPGNRVSVGTFTEWTVNGSPWNEINSARLINWERKWKGKGFEL